VDIPRTVEHITPEWLTGALRAGGSLESGQVKSVRIEPIGEGMGFVGRLVRVVVEYSGDTGSAPPTLIAKIAISNDEVREYAAGLGLYERETRIHVELGDDLGVRIPKLYYGESAANAGLFVLLLEDLSHLRVGDEAGGGSIGDARAAIQNAAQLHARWWNDKRLVQHDWLNRPLDSGQAQTRQRLYLDAWEAVSGQLKSALPAEVYEIGKRLGPNLADVWSAASPAALTLNHGDYRLANLFLDAGDVVTFDWQYALHGPPAIDLADFLVWSLTEDQRRKNEESLIDLYLETLVACGVHTYTRDQAIQDCCLGMLRNLENYVVSIPFLAMDSPSGRIWVDAVSPRMIALAEWDCEALVPD
jgi:hypothetical protein